MILTTKQTPTRTRKVLVVESVVSSQKQRGADDGTW